MLERLIEFWLDNASERSYQAPFCQMLAADKYKVVHSTRHSAIEFGKDIIAVEPNGIPCAFQLKGNPGGRLSLAQFREIQGQLVQLVTQPIVFPGIDETVRHNTYLVTNGYIEEEVQRAVDDLNRTFEVQGLGENRLKVWTRGDLLDMAIPQFLSHYWWFCQTGKSVYDEFYVAALLRTVITQARHGGSNQFPSPYWNFNDLLRHALHQFLDVPDPLRRETTMGISYSAMGLFHLLVRSNLKIECKSLWPEFTRLICCHYEPDDAWQFCLWRSEEGTEHQIVPEPSKKWSDLVDEARDCRLSKVPESLAKRFHLLLLLIIVFPHRATPEVIRYLGLKFGSAWFIPPAIT